MVISLGRILWMMEKSGAEKNDLLPGTAGSRHRTAMRCARNIARWWMVEFHERVKKNPRISYPGEVAMPRGLMPIALWLGVCEYGGIWRAGGGDEDFADREQVGYLGDNRVASEYDVFSVYGVSTAGGHVLRPPWYRDRFVEWAEEISRMTHLPDLTKHCSLLRRNWCGTYGCPYPYVTERIIAPSADFPDRQVVKESPTPRHIYERALYPMWGAFLRDENTGQVEEEEEREPDDDDYSPISVEG